jgi:hypothetical protein
MKQFCQPENMKNQIFILFAKSQKTRGRYVKMGVKSFQGKNDVLRHAVSALHDPNCA